MAAPLLRSVPDRPLGGSAGGGWRPLLQLSVPAFAWEFLRRNPDYRSDFAGHTVDVDPRWGLRFPADPALPHAQAGVFWREDVAPGIVLPIVGPAPETSPYLSKPQWEGAPREGEDGLHLRLVAGLQLLFRRPRERSGPVLVVLRFDQEFGLRVRAVQALERAVNSRSAPRSRLTAAQRLRLARSLVALDGFERRDTYRDIARTVFGDEAVEREAWRTASVRDATIRLVRTGRRLMRGGYLKLLWDGL
ncbi:DUF2285 domain-containing protein [Caulobacter segnis]|uniref:DUF2285 domain-containing protein n=1 Tax=Caulobacter segnis TaxID=88688 RepID=A0A2W5VBX5_9CAUL|nr:DUF2285 domain-containing protein [Caulobacter segnis]PZR34106.1 MAG: hypothetical protein DI526_11505 [Caulobacter segnis]